jgi:hypothetical protein
MTYTMPIRTAARIGMLERYAVTALRRRQKKTVAFPLTWWLVDMMGAEAQAQAGQ